MKGMSDKELLGNKKKKGTEQEQMQRDRGWITHTRKSFLMEYLPTRLEHVPKINYAK